MWRITSSLVSCGSRPRRLLLQRLHRSSRHGGHHCIRHTTASAVMSSGTIGTPPLRPVVVLLHPPGIWHAANAAVPDPSLSSSSSFAWQRASTPPTQSSLTWRRARRRRHHCDRPRREGVVSTIRDFPADGHPIAPVVVVLAHSDDDVHDYDDDDDDRLDYHHHRQRQQQQQYCHPATLQAFLSTHLHHQHHQQQPLPSPFPIRRHARQFSSTSSSSSSSSSSSWFKEWILQTPLPSSRELSIFGNSNHHHRHHHNMNNNYTDTNQHFVSRDCVDVRSVVPSTFSSSLFRMEWMKGGSEWWWLLELLWKNVNDPNRPIPKGMEDFFPPGSKLPPPLPSNNSNKEENDANNNTNEHDTESSSTFERRTNDTNNNNNNTDSTNETRAKSQDQQQQQQQKSPPPPPSSKDDSANLTGLLAVLAIVMTLRQVLEQEERDLGQEITFMEFRNQLLWTGQVHKIVVVNNKVARIELKPSTVGGNGMEDGGSGGGGGGGGHSSTTTTSTTTNNMNTNQNHEEEFTWEDQRGQRLLASGRNLHQQQQQSRPYYFYIGSVEALEEKLTKAQAHIHPSKWVEVQYISSSNWAMELIKLLPVAAMILALHHGIRLMGGLRGGSSGSGGSSIFSVGRSTARKINKEDISVTFKDVAGCQQAKEEVMEFVDFLKDPDRFTKLGAKIPKGALLYGPPGTGKTLLAKAVAGESGVPFYSISGSDFIEMFVGVGPSRVRDLFKEARANSPCIVFIDEIDAVGRKRGRGGFSGGNDERENTLNQLLVEMDGFSTTTGIVVLAGTNRIDILDQALTRPGRFDRQITVDRPDLQGRKEIFQVHLQNIKLEGEISEYASRLAGLTPGFAGADIANICNEAAIVAARRKATAVTMEDFEKATDRIIGGLESNKIMSNEERSIVAHHEAGHAIAGWFLEHADPLLKVTIIPRNSGALGFAQYLPKEVFLRSQDQIMDLVCMALAGRAAEEVFFGRVTTGASDDLRRVTQLVYSMIREFGMNSHLGQLAFPQRESQPGDKPYSDATAEAMDEEARNVVDAAYSKTVQLIRDRKGDVEKLANRLLENETLTHDDIVDLIGPRPFQGDSVYQEYVSSKSRLNKEDSSVAGNDDESVSLDPTNLAPGFAYRVR